MRTRFPAWLIGLTVTVCAASGAGAAYTSLTAGPTRDGTAVTPVGWRVTPAGSQHGLGFLPTNGVPAPGGRALVVANAGGGGQSIQVLDPATGQTLQTIAGNGVSMGLAFDHAGKRLFVAAGGADKVRVFSWDAAGRRLAEQAPIGGVKSTDGVALTADDSALLVTESLANRLAVVDLSTGKVTASIPTGAHPFDVAVAPDGRHAFVTNLGESSVTVVDLAGPTVSDTLAVGVHPNRIELDPSGERAYVSNGDSNAVSVIDTRAAQVVRTLELEPGASRAGAAPAGSAVSPDGRTLYVANAGADDVSVVDTASGSVKGLIPTAWYPTDVVAAPDGGHLLVLNGKGLGSGPNDGSTNPATNPVTLNDHAFKYDPRNAGGQPYIMDTLRGTLSIVPAPGAGTLEAMTAQVKKNHRATGQTGNGGDGVVIPRHPGGRSPIKHVIYIVRENRTYDQVLGDLRNSDGSRRGNGDKSLAIYGRQVTPNAHALARRFVTFDNFYVNSEVSAQGWTWALSGNSNYFTELKTNQSYGGAGYPYVWEGLGGADGLRSAAGSRQPDKAYLWNALAARKIAFREFGQYTFPVTQDGATTYHAVDPELEANTNHDYPWFDMSITDQHRFDVWKKEWDRHVADHDLPTMQLISLPRDHTGGLSPDVQTPPEMVADNDAALGKIVDTVSHSKYWKDTAIFVVEDDAQAGPDHVDAHRTVAFVISPYTQTGKIDSNFYNQVSMLRTMELIVGLPPLSQFDAQAVPMVSAFTGSPDFAAYNAKIAPLALRNDLNGAPGTVDPSTVTDLELQKVTRPDAIDEREFNRELWKASRGADAEPPAPVYHVLPAPSVTGEGDR